MTFSCTTVFKEVSLPPYVLVHILVFFLFPTGKRDLKSRYFGSSQAALRGSEMAFTVWCEKDFNTYLRLAIHFSHFASVFAKYTMKYETLIAFHVNFVFY